MDSLIASARDGDPGAFASLCEAVRPALERHIHIVCGDIELARDITQTTFTKAYNKLSSTRPGKLYWRAWLYTIANNIIRDLRRRDQILRTFSLDEKVAHFEDTDTDEYIAISGGTVALSGSATIAQNPADIYEAHESALAQHHALSNLLRALDPTLSRLLVLSSQGHTYAHIASLTDMTPGEVKSALARARRDARALWSTLQP